MAVIYSASGDQNSMHHSSRIVEPVLRWLFPDISYYGLMKMGFLARKGAHLFVYAVLAGLLWLAMVGTLDPLRGRWSWRPVLWTLGVIVLYASFDELHQSFVPNRQGTHWDVLIDSVGACIGLAVVWAIGKWRGRW
jgi:hypothetical protein